MKQINTNGKKIIFIDCETTGVDTGKDKIVQLAAVRFNPETKKIAKKVWLINPRIRIPKEASAIHNITDEMVKDAPIFLDVAIEIKEAIKDCVLAGYNINTFDIPILRREFYDCGLRFIDDCETIDVFRIVKKLFPRNLKDMYERYTGKSAEGSHDAFNDCLHAFELLECLMEKEPIPSSVKELNEYYYDEKVDKHKYYDSTGKIVIDEKGFLLYNFGKHKGKRIDEEKEYALWMINSSDMFPKDTIEIVKQAIRYK